jgi:hypothetical protein
MDWLFGKKEEKKKDVVDTIQIKRLDKKDLPKIKIDPGFKMPTKPGFKTK